MTTAETKIVDTTYHSLGFPQLGNEILERNNYLAQIEDSFSKGIKLVFLEGEEDSGKTTICAQFARKNATESVSIFFNSLNKNDFNLEYFFFNFVDQVKILLGEFFDSDINQRVTREDFQQKLIQARRLAKKKNKKLILIVDGLENSIVHNDSFFKELVPVLPIGDEEVILLISGSEKKFKEAYNKNIQTKEIQISGFSAPEIAKYLGRDEKEIFSRKDIFSVTKGYPGRLKTLKHILQETNFSIDELPNNNSYINWIELDCQSTDLKDAKTVAILSLLSLQDKAFAIGQIASICNLNESDVDEVIKTFKFLDKINNLPVFRSKSYKAYFKSVLKQNQKQVEDYLIKYYSENTESIANLLELPILYNRTNQWREILAILDDGYTTNVIRQTESLRHLSHNLNIGIKAAKKTDNYPGAFKYALEASLLNELFIHQHSQNEILALLALDDYKGAIDLANKAALKIDRLKLLASIARKQKELTKKVDEDLVSQIKSLYHSSDLHVLDEKVFDIASDLIYVIPNLAIELIEKSGESNDNSDINDWIITKLAFAAIDSSIKENEDPFTSKRVEIVNKHLTAQNERLTKSIALLVGNYSADIFIEEVDRLSDSAERLKLIRLWLANKEGKYENIDKVISKGLDELLAASSKAHITLDILMELAKLLSKVTDKEELDRLYYRFREVEKGLTRLGSTRKKAIYDLSMFHAVFLLDTYEGNSELRKIMRSSDVISDDLFKLEVKCEIFRKLIEINFGPFKHHVRTIQNEISLIAHSLYENTANHYEISKKFIKTVGTVDPVFALQTLSKANREETRDSLIITTLKGYLKKNILIVDFNIVKVLFNSIQSAAIKENFCIELLQNFVDLKNISNKSINELWKYVSLIDNFKGQAKSYGFSLAIQVCSKNKPKFSEQKKNLQNKLRISIDQLDSEWERIDIGFLACSDIVEYDVVFAKQLFENSKKVRDESWLDSGPVFNSYVHLVRLAAKCFTPLIIEGESANEDEGIINKLIDRVPSEQSRVDIWTEIALTAHSQEKESYARKTLNSKIIPSIERIKSKSNNFSEILDCFTLVYLFNPSLAERYISQLAEREREITYLNICEYCLSKRNPFDFYDWDSRGFRTNYSDLQHAIAVLSKIRRDSYIYIAVNRIVESIIISKNEISKIQNQELLEQIEMAIKDKLPDRRNIKHEGYKILIDFKIMKASYSKLSQDLWIKLIKRIDEISNISDRIFISEIVLDEIPSYTYSINLDLKRHLFDKIVKDLGMLKCQIEYIDRVSGINNTMFRYDRSQWKNILYKTLDLTSELQTSSDVYTNQRKILDTIHSIDSEFASELITRLDTDKSTSINAEMLKRHLKSLDIANKIKNNKPVEEKEREDMKVIVQSIYKALIAINSDKVSPKKIDECSEYFDLGIKLPLQESLPIFLFFINCCIKKYNGKDLSGRVENIHRRNFQNAAKVAGLVEIINARNKSQLKQSRSFELEKDFVYNKVFTPGSRNQAIDYINRWINEDVQEFLIIVDPYFKKEDMTLIKTPALKEKSITIEILGSAFERNSNIVNEYIDYWRIISDEDPPECNITFAWKQKSNSAPFHDRFLLSKNGGLRLGTSINSIGLGKDSEISIIGINEASEIIESSISELLQRRKKQAGEDRIHYQSFSL